MAKRWRCDGANDVKRAASSAGVEERSGELRRHAHGGAEIQRANAPSRCAGAVMNTSPSFDKQSREEALKVGARRATVSRAIREEIDKLRPQKLQVGELYLMSEF